MPEPPARAGAPARARTASAHRDENLVGSLPTMFW